MIKNRTRAFVSSVYFRNGIQLTEVTQELMHLCLRGFSLFPGRVRLRLRKWNTRFSSFSPIESYSVPFLKAEYNSVHSENVIEVSAARLSYVMMVPIPKRNIQYFCVCCFLLCADTIFATCDNFLPFEGEGSFEFQVSTDETKSWFDSVRACKVNVFFTSLGLKTRRLI